MKTGFSNDELKDRDNARKVAEGLKQDVEGTPTDDPKTALARKAYHAYGKVTDFKNFQGNPMPEFDDLPETIKQAWREAAHTVSIEVKAGNILDKPE